MINLVNHISKTCLETLFPYTCVICEEKASSNGMDLCIRCQSLLPWITKACAQCGRHAPQKIGQKCSNCLENPPPFEQCLTPFRYQNPINQMIINFKHQQKLAFGKVLSDLFVKFMQKQPNLVMPDAILPIPLHNKRLKQRGFNQSNELAKSLRKLFKVPIIHNWIERIEYTPAQTTLSAKARQTNLQTVFQCKKNYKFESVAIIDDVMTTGTTVHAVCEILRNQGVKHIQVWTIAATDSMHLHSKEIIVCPSC